MVTALETPLFRAAPKLIPALKERYAEPHRHYHTWDHIKQMLTALDEIEASLTDRDATLYAVYYHDAVYNVPSSTNEEDSAALFASDAAERVDQRTIEKTTSFIIATKTHATDEAIAQDEQEDYRCFLDIDMSILGAKADEYNDYAENVRKEYAIIPDTLYTEGRKQILQGFLEKDRIFLTDHFYGRLERAARANITAEIEKLSS